MTHAVLLERKTRPTQDMLSSMFSAGSMDPAQLPGHPCPPGRKDGTMKTNLMEFQVKLISNEPQKKRSLLICFLFSSFDLNSGFESFLRNKV